MDRRMLSSLLLLLAVVLLVVSPAAGDIRVILAGGEGAHHGVDAAVRQLMMAAPSTARLEDAVAAELGVDMELHRRILAGNIGPGALKPDRPACLQTCPARGGSYSGRGCKSAYRCNNNGG